ncbi:MAG TPA: enolase C-terminal domain-like protein [Polyangiaceae bacterium]|jgi:L-alanine-DL-glutamate epimerase-like enolase superfamily enzyme
MGPRAACTVERIAVSTFEIPTDLPEQDGTLSWNKTVLVTVEAASDGVSSLGYTYADAATAKLIEEKLAPIALGGDALGPEAAYAQMEKATRNLGGDGITAMAVSAMDLALWDLKARLFEVPLATLLGATRTDVPVYGSGGFTSYDLGTLQRQLAGWVKEQGIPRVKMKVGAHPEQDHERVRAAREAIGDEAELFVDANGAHSAKRALAQAQKFAQFGVSWFEEPVSSDRLDALRFVRERVPGGMEVAAGEYGYRLEYFLRMLQASAVDVLQLDATRCGGVTGFLRAAHLSQAFGIPVSTHCAPALHVQLGCACGAVRHLEYFHDHVRIESSLLGAPKARDGVLGFDPALPGFGLVLDTERSAVFQRAHVELRAH